MAISLILGERGTSPEGTDVRAAYALDAVPEGFRLTMDLDVCVPDLDEDGFRRRARALDLPQHHARRLDPASPG
jgi:hypothetical protein